MLIKPIAEIVDKSFHSISEWAVRQKRFRANLGRNEKEDGILTDYAYL
jgi:hypothetical protein